MAKKPIVRRGDIYWIDPSPYHGNGIHVQQADRPGVIVSSREVNAEEWTYEIVYLTTKPKRHHRTHCIITSSYRPSTALCNQITTVSREQIGRYIGRCTAEEMASIEKCIMLSLSLAVPEQENPAKDWAFLLREMDATLIALTDEIDILREKISIMQQNSAPIDNTENII